MEGWKSENYKSLPWQVDGGTPVTKVDQSRSPLRCLTLSTAFRKSILRAGTMFNLQDIRLSGMDGVDLLVRKDYHFDEVATENLQLH